MSRCAPASTRCASNSSRCCREPAAVRLDQFFSYMTKTGGQGCPCPQRKLTCSISLAVDRMFLAAAATEYIGVGDLGGVAAGVEQATDPQMVRNPSSPATLPGTWRQEHWRAGFSYSQKTHLSDGAHRYFMQARRQVRSMDEGTVPGQTFLQPMLLAVAEQVADLGMLRNQSTKSLAKLRAITGRIRTQSIEHPR